MTIYHTDDTSTQFSTLGTVTLADTANTGISTPFLPLLESVANQHFAILDVMRREVGQPVIHTITNPKQLPGSGLYRMYQYNSREDVKFDGVEAWLLESTVIKAWYLFVPFTEAG